MIAITRTPRRYARPHDTVRRDHQGEVLAGTTFRASRSTSAGFHPDATPATSTSTGIDGHREPPHGAARPDGDDQWHSPNPTAQPDDEARPGRNLTARQ